MAKYGNDVFLVLIHEGCYLFLFKSYMDVVQKVRFKHLTWRYWNCKYWDCTDLNISINKGIRIAKYYGNFVIPTIYGNIEGEGIEYALSSISLKKIKGKSSRETILRIIELMRNELKYQDLA